MAAPIRIGRLRHRMTIEAPVDAADGAGGAVRSYEAVATVWAGIEPVSAAHRFEAGRAGQTVTHRIVMRSGWSLGLSHRLRQGTKIFAIRSFDQTCDGMFVIALAEEDAQ
jgi:SPP1 family predicted phage head-tail adaptor